MHEFILTDNGINMKSITRAAYYYVINCLPPRMAITILYIRRLGRVPNLKNPKDFSEKVQMSKLYDRNSLMSVCADKILVKKYVKELIGDRYVIPTIWSGKELPVRGARLWSLPYVIKANHLSGGNYFVRSENDLKWAAIEALTERWLSTSYSPHKHEWAYENIEPKILIEPYISRDHVLPLDYKLFVWKGITHYIQVDVDRENSHKRCFYDPDWQKCNFSLEYPLYEGEIEPPKNLGKMISLAEALSAEFDFLRCDFYEVNGVLFFGEMTFYPDSGFGRFIPREWDRRLGDLWE